MTVLLHRPGDVCYSRTAEPRQARVDTSAFFSPWPWCPYKDHPHDAHPGNDRSSACGGVPGMLPPFPTDRVMELVTYWTKTARDAEDSLRSAQIRLAKAQAELADLRARPELSRSATTPARKGAPAMATSEART